MKYIVDSNNCKVYAMSRKKGPMDLMTTITGRLRPCVTVTAVPATTHPVSPKILNCFF